MARSGFSSTREMEEIARLVRELEGRMRSLGASAKSDVKEAGAALPDYVYEALTDFAERFRGSARNVGGEAARVGSDALRKVEKEVGNRPLATIAIAAGIGFLLGFLNRR
jgi:ElaB/YqjD/DUF883 family membrane-anchored ribosome-binding protein